MLEEIFLQSGKTNEAKGEKKKTEKQWMFTTFILKKKNIFIS